MPEHDAEAPTPAPDPDTGPAGPYTDATRARVAAAYEACELADLARATVPIGAHELTTDGAVRSPGSLLADAAHVLAAAHRFFEAAAVYERLGGAGWQGVGDVLGVSADAARERFAAAEARFHTELHSARATPDVTTASPDVTWWRAHLVREPLEAALDLDDWVRRHADGDVDLGAAPVSGGLVRGDRG
ncbi:hypothetical protein ACIQNU_19940 [Streptomyces sp. NPDC091292]|uniref:hypothetical protein n=1 Tax=Streptomyces sp. NPDC091292 TaxID=3365991 RepID=UPI0038144AF3